MQVRLLLFLLTPLVGSLLSAAAPCETWNLDAKTIFSSSLTDNVQLSADGRSIELASGELVEDDGPAAGYTYEPNVENLGDGVVIKKEFLLTDAAARRATLLIAPGGELQAVINGRDAPLHGPRKVGGYWQAYDFDPAVLRPGLNELVIRGLGKVWIARDEDYSRGSLTRTSHPNRSSKSRDGGKTWNDARLGSGDDLDGEYYVRLFLDRLLPEGRIVTPVIDLGNLRQDAIVPAVGNIGDVEIALEVEQRAGDVVEMYSRRGSTWIVREETWSPWTPLAATSAESPLRFALPRDENSKFRYLQLELRLASGNRIDSPRIRRLSIAAEPQTESRWTEKLRLVESKNPPLVRSSIPFTYEPFDHPKLKRLRTEYKLDEVVGDAGSEMELISRLAAWSAERWEKLGHLGESYPPWDALEILRPHADGGPVGGFCLQFNVVFLQACESFGIPGRIVSISAGDRRSNIRSGHETVELWSNQHEKWIHVDGNTGWCFEDEATGVPLSLLELRERQLAAWEGKNSAPLRLVKLAETRHTWSSLEDWPAFAELRLVPRSNFLEQTSPLPLHQGMRGWFWTGHYVWSDERRPASIYSHRVLKRDDWAPDLNRAEIRLEATSTPGELRVQLDSRTPGLQSYLATIDGHSPRQVEPNFTWRLHPGANRLTVRPRNIAGREGIKTRVALDYTQ
jgi:transglutaminase-like putative cysteine protease